MTADLTLLYTDGEQIGYGRLGVYLADGLRKRGIQVYSDTGGVRPGPQYVDGDRTVAVTPTNLSCIVSIPSHAFGHYEGQHHAVFTMWEATRLPEALRAPLDNFDTVIVPSQQNYDIFSVHHDNVHLCPLGVDPMLWRPTPAPDPELFFDFLISGRGKRKGVDLAYEAFARVFGKWWEWDGDGDVAYVGPSDRPQPRLVMKSIKGHQAYYAPWVAQRTAWMSPTDEVALYANSHCYIQPSRGEGFGLQPLQALALGRPTILTDAHGHAGYAHLGIPISATEVDAEKFMLGFSGTWWEPDLEELCEAMWDVYQNYESHVERAVKNAVVVADEWTWDRTVDRFIEIFDGEFDKAYTGDGTWVPSTERLYPIVTVRDHTSHAAGVTRFFRQGELYWDIADVHRILFDNGVLDPVCIEGESHGLAPEQLPEVDRYRAMHEFCPTCHERLNTRPNLSDEILAGPRDRVKTAAVITTHDEADSIGELVAMLIMVVDDVIVIDENSTDGTRGIAKEAGATLVRSSGGGIGPCQRYGWRQALLRGADRVVQIDAGGSHDAAYIPHMLTLHADVVIGSRFVEDGRHTGPFWRQYGSIVFGDLWRLRTGCAVHDWTSGYRVFTRHACEVLLKHDYRCRMHGWQAEAVAWAYKDGLQVVESPIVYDMSDSGLSWRVTREAMRGLVSWGH